MPVKKKSGFQITSVTTAQVAASSITEDTESLEDPDESRTEDISSEIFDVSSRATDYEHAEVCDRSSSDETLNNVGEADTPGALSPNIPHDRETFGGRLPGAGGGGGTVTPVPASGPVSGPATAPGATPPASTSVSGTSAGGLAMMQPAVACTSRFRVIKLDHGSGEPFRRGRWTCTEFYDRDSDGTMLARSADSIRHNSSSSSSVALEQQQCADRDSGLGATATSLQSVHGTDSPADISISAAVTQLAQTDVINQHQSFAKGQQSTSGLPVTQAASGTQIYTSAVGAQQHQSQNSLGQLSVLQTGINGMAIHTASASSSQTNVAANVHASQTQQFQFSPIPHLLPSQSTVLNSHTEYMQHLPAMHGLGTVQQSSPGTVIQNTAAMSLPAGQVTSQGPSPVMQSPASGTQVVGVPAQSSDLDSQSGQGKQNARPGPTKGLILQQQSLGSSAVQQQHLTQQHQALGLSGMVSQVSGLPTVAAGIQNVPSTGVSSVPAVVPSVSATSVTMPSVPATMVQSQQSTQIPMTGSTGLIQSGLPPAMQGSINLSSIVSQTNLLQTQQGTGHLEERRNSEQLIPQTSQSGESKSSMKPLIPEILGNPLNLQVASPMNSLTNSVFSIQIDGDEDSASGASVVAIDNKIEQAMDLVKSHLMYAVREEVEVLKEQIKELIEKNCILERENSLLKSLANNDQLSQLQTQVTNLSSTSQPQQPTAVAQPQQSAQQTQPPLQPNVPSA
ncbi:TSC22 domain family protein 2-like isoform X2 [Pristis pectinata]|uniref:TSC22 domain family protein 2-like isoform X2 n=1 Tax=Pristis pectinata TaxID=685728 RepID=UPI00223D16CE|nr:TSC22 domain family protein 2-like isoform X2 [Pristis pectinata]